MSFHTIEQAPARLNRNALTVPESRLEFTVIGNVVNVASRIERLTRSYNAPLTTS